jgi:hypothetical protein
MKSVRAPPSGKTAAAPAQQEILICGKTRLAGTVNKRFYMKGVTIVF